MVPGVSIMEYDLSSDGLGSDFLYAAAGRVLATLVGRSGSEFASQVDRRFRRDFAALRSGGADLIPIDRGEKKRMNIAQLNRHGSGRSKLVSHPIGNTQSISPDRRWIVAIFPLLVGTISATMAVRTGGGAPRRICAGSCPATWAPDGKFLYIGLERKSRTSRAKTLAIPGPRGEVLPDLPASGIGGDAFRPAWTEPAQIRLRAWLSDPSSANTVVRI